MVLLLVLFSVANKIYMEEKKRNTVIFLHCRMLYARKVKNDVTTKKKKIITKSCDVDFYVKK